MQMERGSYTTWPDWLTYVVRKFRMMSAPGTAEPALTAPATARGAGQGICGQDGSHSRGAQHQQQGQSDASSPLHQPTLRSAFLAASLPHPAMSPIPNGCLAPGTDLPRMKSISTAMSLTMVLRAAERLSSVPVKQTL